KFCMTTDTMKPEGERFLSEEVEQTDTKCQDKPSKVVVEFSRENRNDTYLKYKENGCQVDGCKSFFFGMRNFSLCEIHQKDGNECPSIILLNCFQNHTV